MITPRMSIMQCGDSELMKCCRISLKAIVSVRIDAVDARNRINLNKIGKPEARLSTD